MAKTTIKKKKHKSHGEYIITLELRLPEISRYRFSMNQHRSGKVIKTDKKSTIRLDFGSIGEHVCHIFLHIIPAERCQYIATIERQYLIH